MTTEGFDAVVVGAGQAGLVASRALTQRGLSHVVLEAGATAYMGAFVDARRCDNDAPR